MVRRKPYHTNDISKHPVMNKSKLVSNQQIYLDCRKLIDKVLDVTPNFPREYKLRTKTLQRIRDGDY